MKLNSKENQVSVKMLVCENTLPIKKSSRKLGGKAQIGRHPEAIQLHRQSYHPICPPVGASIRLLEVGC